MLPEISEIRNCRKRLGLTQEQLSEISSVSQSLIAKMESGKITPGYDKARRIFSALERVEKKESLRAGDIMSRKIRSVRPDDSARKAVTVMEKNGFSQVPVLDRNSCAGTVTEGGTLAALDELGAKEFNSARAAAIMEGPLPVVGEQTIFPVLAGILQHERALLVSRKGKLVGIITKSDLLKSALVGR